MWVTPVSLQNLIPSTRSASPDRSATNQRKGEFKNRLFLLLLFSISISSEDNSGIPRSSTAPRNNTQLISIKPLQYGLLTTTPKAFLTSLCFLLIFQSTPQHRGLVTGIKSNEKWNNGVLWSKDLAPRLQTETPAGSRSVTGNNKSSTHLLPY